VALPDVPFDARGGIIPNEGGRVINPENKQPVEGEYVVGWIKRGPSGIIGTNKPDALDTVNKMIEDVSNLPALDPSNASPLAIEQLIKSRQPDYVTYTDWLLLDKLEQENGANQDRPRIKFSRVADMLAALSKAKEGV
jgi:ferredoxin--NADP+ reductase